MAKGLIQKTVAAMLNVEGQAQSGSMGSRNRVIIEPSAVQRLV